MANLFSKPNIPTPAPPVVVPTVDMAAQAQDVSDRLKKRKGSASTILVPSMAGSPLGGGTTATTLLGNPVLPTV